MLDSRSRRGLAGVAIEVLDSDQRTTTDGAGRFQFSLPPGPLALRFGREGFFVVERELTLRAGEPVTDLELSLEPEVTDLELVVTGARTPRSRAETPVPVDVITAADIARSGQNETSRILSTLVPSYNAAPQTIADGSDHVAPASLRGMAPDQVLVLVNGKRRHPSALVHVNGTFGRGTVGTDLNAIPASAIERIEVLRDGAATQYGTGAIAGVINIVLKDDTDALNLGASAGVTGEGDGRQLRATTHWGTQLGDEGFLDVSAEFLSREATNRTGDYIGPIFDESDPQRDQRLLQERGLTRDDFNMRIGESAARAGSLFYNAGTKLLSQVELYSFGGISHRDGDSGGFYRFPFQEAQVVAELYPLGFLPLIKARIDDVAATAGMRGEIDGWHLDLSFTRGHNAFRYIVENSNNASLGTSSPTTFDAGGFAHAESVFNLDVRRELDIGIFRSLNLIAGSEFRLEEYQIVAGDEASYVLGPETFGDPPQPAAPGAQVFPGFSPDNAVDRTRNNIGLYAGLESEPLRGIVIDLGGRAEHYSDFGMALIGKGAARVEVVPGFSLRAAAGSGFRAPSLQQLWFNNVSTQFVADRDTGELSARQVLTSQNDSPVTRAFGIPELGQETSLNASAGITLAPHRDLGLTLDGYVIGVKDRIVLTGRFSDADPVVADLLAPFPSVSRAQFFANAIDTLTRGIDLVADYTLRFAAHQIKFSLSANLNYTEVTGVHLPDSLQVGGGDEVALRETFFGRQDRNRLEDAVPRHRGTATVHYLWGDLSLLGRASYYGKVHFKPEQREFDEEFAGKTLFDLEAGYRVDEHMQLVVGAQNLFNTFPDQQEKEGNRGMGRFIYNRNVSQFGLNGGFYYARLQVSWL